MTNQQSTVMGPGGLTSPASTLLPPTFDEKTDRLVWRESVRDWSDNVLACATGGDSKAKGIAACLGLTLYRSLPTGSKEQIKQSVRSGEIILTPNESTGPADQVNIVKKILDVVAKNTAVDRISRMVRLNTQVHKCTRKSGETIKDFVARFKVPSFAYLNIIRADCNSSDSQIFAMTLIINAQLGEQLFANTISTLITNTKCASDEGEEHVAIRKSRLNKLVKAANSRDENSGEFDECMTVINAAVDAHEKANGEGDESHGFITLASALEALESISLEQKTMTETAEKNPIESTAVLMGNTGRDYDQNTREKNIGTPLYRGWNNRTRGGFHHNNRGRYQVGRAWKGHDNWERTDLRDQIEKKRGSNAESKNDERYRKRSRFGDNRDENENGQSFR